MGDLVRTPHCEVTATLEVLEHLGVRPEHFACLRSDARAAMRVAAALTEETYGLKDSVTTRHTSMGAWAVGRSWLYVVPPENIIRVVIAQRLDGVFGATADVPGQQYFYISAERYDDATNSWQLVGEKDSIFNPRVVTRSSWGAAFEIASQFWTALREGKGVGGRR